MITLEREREREKQRVKALREKGGFIEGQRLDDEAEQTWMME